MKRIFDIIVSLMGLIVLSPLFLLISLAIIISMPGKILFKQDRVGKNGKPFKVYKFRTMKSISDASKGRFDAGDISRVTKLGFILRKYKLDELPQLFNVLFGSMALVGPRPEVKKWTEVYPEKWKIVLQVKPGITDYASIIFRHEEEILARSHNAEDKYKNEILPKKLDMYISYVNNRSFFGDLIIILRTIKKVIL